jgi:hypothetical protein
MPWWNPWSWAKQDEATSIDHVKAKATQAANSAAQALSNAGKALHDEARDPASSQLGAFSQPQTVVATVVLTSVSLGFFTFYRKFLRRIPQAANINPDWLRKRSLVGKVTSVGDGDNFRIWHTPGGRLAGWGWLPGRRVPTDKKELKNQTVYYDQRHETVLLY